MATGVEAMDLRSNGSAGLIMAMAVQGVAQGAAASGTSQQAIAAAVTAALRTAWALLAGADSEEDAELAMRWQAMQPAMRQQVHGAPLCGGARARRNVGAHVGLGKGVEALRQALARPQHAQRGGRCGPRKKQAASQNHIVDDPEAREDAGEEEHQRPFEKDARVGHADGVQMEGGTSMGIREPDVDDCKGTDQVVGTPEGEVNDKEGATEVGGYPFDVVRPLGGGSQVISQATDGPVEVAPLSEDVVRGQTAAETEAVRLTEPVVPPPLASGLRWWKQDVGEASAKVREDPVMQGRLCEAAPKGRRRWQQQGGEEAADNGFVLPSVLAQMEESVEAQRRAQASHVDELAKMLALRAQELTVALRCGAVGAVDEAKARLRAAVDQRRQAAAQFDGKMALLEQRREAWRAESAAQGLLARRDGLAGGTPAGDERNHSDDATLPILHRGRRGGQEASQRRPPVRPEAAEAAAAAREPAAGGPSSSSAPARRTRFLSQEDATSAYGPSDAYSPSDASPGSSRSGGRRTRLGTAAAGAVVAAAVAAGLCRLGGGGAGHRLLGLLLSAGTRLAARHAALSEALGYPLVTVALAISGSLSGAWIGVRARRRQLKRLASLSNHCPFQIHGSGTSVDETMTRRCSFCRATTSPTMCSPAPSA
ncbi:unnamed protein product [Prorocentrum cordatum]|uniref:Uncharacterized protein n=1 Tax=Prorocentrum cordatum TaxID=2364126 RepID=A0ABN9VXG4_9DINO|nr:unnamed protein product [Polarella glacialis]